MTPEQREEIITKINEHNEADEKQFDKINTRLNDIFDDTKEIKILLKGNDDYDIEGLATQVHRHEEWLKKAKWTAVLIGALITFASFCVSQLPQFLANHTK